MGARQIAACQPHDDGSLTMCEILDDRCSRIEVTLSAIGRVSAVSPPFDLFTAANHLHAKALFTDSQNPTESILLAD
jgi:hypothetical protein